MPLPFGPPLQPMLAKLASELPRGDGWLYDPKWDGFRAIAFRDGDDLFLASRNGRPLGRYFPEVVGALKEALPEACVVDGEIIRPTPEGLDFDALQLRLHPAASRVELLAVELPCSFVAFDLLAQGEEDLRHRPLSGRLEALDAILDEAPDPARGPSPRVMRTPRTTDAATAERWFDELELAGLDGIIAKRLDEPYAPGQRTMAKIKHRRTADCVVGGYRLHKTGDGVGSLLLGLYQDRDLRYVGHTSSFKAAERRRILELIRPLEGADAFGWERAPGGPSRWSAGKDLAWTPLEPVLVCEVAYDHIQAGERFRHAATFLRWREDKDPQDCTWDQVERS